MGDVNVKIIYRENVLTANDFIFLQESVGWGGQINQMEKALQNTIFSVSAYDGDDIVGMGRLVGDGAFIWYIMNLVIQPQYQRNGIGTEIMKRLLSYISKESLPETNVTIGLFSAKGKEPYYEKFGFKTRPDENFGAGMQLRIKFTERASEK